SRNGKYQQVDDYQAGDMLKGKLTELDGNGAEKENGICLEEAVMLPMYMKNDEQKTRFEGKHKDDIVVINPYAAWDGNAAELASLLKIEKELAAEMKSDFNFRITELTRHIPGELNQELFDQALGKDVVTNEADFRAHIKEMLRKQHEEESDVKFMIDLHSYLMEKVGKPEYAEDILRRYMDTTSKKENPVSDEEFRKNLDSITWYLIREKLLAANDIKVADEDVLKMAKEVTRNQFAQYGMLTVPDELLEKYAHEMLRKEETVDSLVDRAINEKIGQAVKKQVTLNMHTVTVAEFNKLFE
ncbi:MAG: trigger factor, partial [Prevotellaceae bacterium]|nr:trigger factor [Prevotellaceae bacterium]